MYFEIFPMLSKGFFALYYGGPDILNNLDDRTGSITRLNMVSKNFFERNVIYLF